MGEKLNAYLLLRNLPVSPIFLLHSLTSGVILPLQLRSLSLPVLVERLLALPSLGCDSRFARSRFKNLGRGGELTGDFDCPVPSDDILSSSWSEGSSIPITGIWRAGSILIRSFIELLRGSIPGLSSAPVPLLGIVGRFSAETLMVCLPEPLVMFWGWSLVLRSPLIRSLLPRFNR